MKYILFIAMDLALYPFLLVLLIELIEQRYE